MCIVAGLGPVGILCSGILGVEESGYGAAHGGRIQDGELFAVLEAELGQLMEVGSSLMRFQRGPCWEGGLCGGNGLVRVGFCCFIDFGDC